MSDDAQWPWRPATAADSAFLASLFRSTRPELALLPNGPAEPIIAEQQRLQETGYRRAHPGAQMLIVEAVGEPAGRVVLDEQVGLTRVVDLAVLPVFRGRGCASTVLRRIRQQAAGSGSDVALSVAHDNMTALRLYLSLGFVEVARDAVRASLRWRAAQ
jgi:ribosomal protein S18 acetylase RimI-like enzyme